MLSISITREKHPFIDATGFTSNIDLTVDADLTDVNRPEKGVATARSGCGYVGTKKMKVVVIRDR